MKRLLFLILLCGCSTGSGVRGPQMNGRQPAAADEAAGGEVPAQSIPQTFKIFRAREANPFAKIRSTMPGTPRAIGGYSGGCLSGGVEMPKRGEGFEMMRLSRHRHFAHPSLIAVLLRGGKELAAEATMLYGDLSQPRGGPMPGGHASHQSGLDADIWFHLLPAGKKLREKQRENLYGASVLAKNYIDLDPRKWHDVYAKQLMWFAGQPETERIFVNAAIKKRLCAQFPGDPRLARLRPWFFHDDHFHLRLKCPEGDTACAPQPPAEGIECEAKDLDGWFAPDVIAKFTTPSKPQPLEVELPVECKILIP